MRYPQKDWPTYTVRYWDHQNNNPGKPLNDTFGNSMACRVKARSEDEAKKRARSRHGALRFHSCIREGKA